MTTYLPESDTQSATAISSQPARSPQPKRIVLTGFMGAGKSTVGRLLAERLGWRFHDVDEAIVQRAGRSVADIFTEEGEFAFRRRESCAIAAALGEEHMVIALGGGALETLANRLLLEQTDRTTVVHLDAPFDVLYDRCVLQGSGTVRPLLLDPVAAAGRYHERAAHYRRTAKHRVETAKQRPEDTVAAILECMGR